MSTRKMVRVLICSLLLACALASDLKAKCSDPLPELCTTAKFLGEVNGCACFECEPETEKAKTVCTRDDDTKSKLFERRAPIELPQVTQLDSGE